MKWLPVLLALLLGTCMPQTAGAQTPEQELAAEQLQHRGEWVLEFGPPATRAADAMAIFEQVIARYPDSKMCRWARLKKVQCLQWLRRNNEAIDLSNEIVRDYPGELVASWALLLRGVSDLRDWEEGAAPNYVNAYITFQRVRSDYAHLSDNGAVVAAEERMGDILRRIGLYPAGRSTQEILAMARDQDELVLTLGMNVASATVSVDPVRVDLASAVDQCEALARAYPDARHALAKVALSIGHRYVDAMIRGLVEATPADAARLQAVLAKVPALAPDDTNAVIRSTLTLAKYHAYARDGDHTAALRLLESVDLSSLPAGVGPELLHMLAHRLTEVGRYADAAAAWDRIVEDYPGSGFCWIARRGLVGLRLREADYAGAERIALDLLGNDGEFSGRLRAKETLAYIYKISGRRAQETEVLEGLLQDVHGWLSDSAACTTRWRQTAEQLASRTQRRLALLREGN